jgi:predicted nucleic acid-binding protein
MPRKPRKPRKTLLFIDTNIYLDFYRLRNSKVSLQLLQALNRHVDKLILTEQVEMEYKKKSTKSHSGYSAWPKRAEL